MCHKIRQFEQSCLPVQSPLVSGPLLVNLELDGRVPEGASVFAADSLPAVCYTDGPYLRETKYLPKEELKTINAKPGSSPTKSQSFGKLHASAQSNPNYRCVREWPSYLINCPLSHPFILLFYFAIKERHNELNYGWLWMNERNKNIEINGGRVVSSRVPHGGIVECAHT